MHWFIKKPVPLEPEKMAGFGVRRPEGLSFAAEIEVVPIGFSEVIPCSLWYPVFFGLSGREPLILVALGAGKKSLFLNPDNSWKISVVPRVLQIYPFGIIKSGEEEYTIVVEEEYLVEGEGEPLFTDEGETVYFQNIKTQIEEVAQDLYEASRKAREIIELGLVQRLELYHRFSFGEMYLKNALTADVRKLSHLQPEKIYHLVVKGVLPALLAQNLSMRNFALFELFHRFEGRLPF